MLTERARRTDDDVRYRAALMPELEREFRLLHQQFRETEAELEDANDELRAKKRTNVRLKRRIASLEATERPDEGVSQTRERGPWSDDEDDEDYHPGDVPSSFPRGDGDGSSPQHHQGSHSPHNEDGAGPADVEPEQLASVGLEAIAQPSKEDMVYLCRWRPGELEGYCDAVVDSKQVTPGPMRRSCEEGMLIFLFFLSGITRACVFSPSFLPLNPLSHPDERLLLRVRTAANQQSFSAVSSGACS
jgi:hypothetical protein